MRRSWWCAVVLTSLAFLAEAVPTVRVATYPDYAPLCFYAPDANRSQYQETLGPNEPSRLFTGLAWDVVLRSFQLSGYRVELTIVPWARALKMLDQGKIDAVFPAIQTDSRRARYLFSRRQVYPANPLLVYTRGEPPATLEGLLGQRIGMIRSFSYGQVWQEFIERHQVTPVLLKGARQGFAMLEKGRIDGLVGYQFSHDYLLQSLDKLGVFAKTNPFDRARSFLMAREGAGQILDDFNIGRLRLEKTGEYQKLLRRWQVDDAIAMDHNLEVIP